MSASTDTKWVADGLLSRSNLRAGTDPFVLAVACGLTLCPRTRAGAALRGRSVHYDRCAGPEAKASMVLHEVARWALRWCRVRPTVARIAAVELVLRDGSRCAD